LRLCEIWPISYARIASSRTARAHQEATLPNLHRLLESDRSPDSIVAFGSAGERTWRDLFADVAALEAAVRRAGTGAWLLFSEDSYAFAVSLMALAGAGSHAVLPPNRQPGTLRELAAGTAGTILDPAVEPNDFRGRPRIDPLNPGGGGVQKHRALDRDARFAELYTSGTTGRGTAICKRLRHLEDEVAELEAHFGAALGDAFVHATVSHQHIYGMLLRVLWPLAAGRPFSRDTFLHPEEVLPRVAETTGAVLVTTPVHLRTMTESGALKSLVAGTTTFSSGAPLDGRTARAVAATVGIAPIEILGSTETGGVAWRRRPLGDEAAWKPFDAVQIDRDQSDGRLLVQSPFVSVGESRAGGTGLRFKMGDTIELVEDGFHLRGRADRTVKIGAKRLSLPDMEIRLQAHPLVAEAALVSLARTPEPRLGAAVVLTGEGREALRGRGRRALGVLLADHLAAFWDRVLLPRAWRYVDDLPRNQQGKVTHRALRGLFDEPVLDPVVLEQTRSEGAVELRLSVPADLAFLDGHFDNFPVVAGVVEIQWAVSLAMQHLGLHANVRAIEALKFNQPLTPGRQFSLRLDLAPSRDRLHFRFSDDDRDFSSGRILFDTPDE
jgi:acyl-CoA synthetase (AMP-forming)/AMP-acid ligase II